MNYFNYFTEIEDAFVRRRGKHLLLSPMDWALIESWKELGVPLHIALRGIERAFDSWEAKPRKRTVKSLFYCQEEVEAQFAEWVESRVGAGAEPSGDGSAQAPNEQEGSPFSRASVLEHLQQGRAALVATAAERKRTGEDDLFETLTRAASLLEALEQDFAEAADPDARKLEDSLTGLERMLSEAVRRVASAEQLGAIRSEVEEMLRPYRRQMETSVYRQTLNNLLLKRLREQFAVPRLSLFYL